jgi:UPF0755 protein
VALQKKKMKKNLILITTATLFVCFVYICAELFLPLPADFEPKDIYVPKGANFRQTVEILSIEHLVRDKKLFLFIGKLTGVDRRVRAGYYSMEGVERPFDVIMRLRSGKIIENIVTIIEGDSLPEISEKLAEKKVIDKETFNRLSKDKSFLWAYNIDAPTVEGYLYPDTYAFPKGIEPEEALGIMIDKMRQKYTYDLRMKAALIGFTEREVLTLASIIEKEAVIEKERPLISAVYHNRLRKNMPLQADPTAIYGVKSSKSRITLKDLKNKTPYNTYIQKGLPPGPIASPSFNSIVAAVNPEYVPYIYFVSNNDGSHTFSVTAKEHSKAVQIYRDKRSKTKSKKSS